MMDWDFFGKAWATLANRLVSYFPTLLATVVLLLVGWLVSWLLATIVRRSLRGMKLDDWVANSDLAATLERAAIKRPPSQLVARVVFWLLFVCFAVIGLENLGLKLSELPIRSFIAYLPVVLGALLILAAGLLVAAFLGRATDAGLAAMGVEYHRRLGRVVRSVLTAVTAVVVVEQLGFDVTMLTRTFSNLLVIVVAGVVFAFAWGGREVARNVLAGRYVREQFRTGDRITVDGHEGALAHTGSLNTRLTTEDGEVVVPNSRLTEQTVLKRPAR
ncbi:MAG: mechanosensitive ion channel family protein [Acidobacteriota bacterium]|nr:mechanosensitive ion channel family protein [Acidobacteriota bacterium]